MGQKILGLDVGSYSIKGVLLERNWQDFTVLGYFEHVNESNSALTPSQQLSYNLQKFFEEHPLPPETGVVTAIPAQSVRYRFLDLPFGNMKKIEQAMDFELENFIPLDLEKVWFDYHVLSLSKTHSEVLVAYTQRDEFQSLLGILEQYHLNPRKMSGDAISLAHLARVAMLPAEGQYALLDFGHSKTSIVVMDGQSLRYSRTMLMGSQAITQKISKALEVDITHAERLKQEELILEPYLDGESPLAQAAGETIKEWLVFVRQSLAAYAQSGEGKMVQAMYITGGGSRLQGLQKVLSSHLKMNVANLDSLAFTPHRLREPVKVMPSFSPAFAIALNAITWPKQVEINFLRGEFAYRGDIEEFEQVVKRAAMWIGIVMAAGLIHYMVSHYSLSDKVEDVRKQAKDVLGKDLGAAVAKNKNMSLNTALSIVSGKTEELTQKLGALAGTGNVMNPLAIIKEISERVPKTDDTFKMDIDSLNITENLVRLEGRANSFEAVDKIKESLSVSSQFFDVKVDNVGKGLKDEVKFSVSLSLEKK